MVVGFCLWLGFGCGRVPVVEGHGGRDSDGGGDVGGGVVVVVVRARENNYVAISRECKFEVIHILERQIIRSAAMAGWPFSLLADSYLQLIVVMMIEIKRVCVVRLKMRLFALWRGELPKLAAMANISSFFESLRHVKRVERLMRGTIQNKVDRETRFTNEFDHFVAEPEEALVSVYNRNSEISPERIFDKIDYATKYQALYKDFVPQKELSAEQKYFPSSFIPSDKNSNATPSIPASMQN
ncbi:hypothetical protein Tco_0368517 [Tanacetum coccineum]